MIKKFRIFYNTITSSIAFLPFIISLLFLLLSLLVVYLELITLQTPLAESLQVLMVKGNDNARHVLGALIGGIISLTVFSFSMVMLLLNQASSSFSPRILPGLLTDKKHQFVLGFYIGTIIYCIIIILNIKPGEESQNSPKFGVLLAMVLGVICLALFIYFIHLISQKLQVDTIISTIARRSVRIIDKTAGTEVAGAGTFKTTVWKPLYTDSNGYLNDVNKDKLRRLAEKHQLQVKLLCPVGTFLLENSPFAQIGSKADGENGRMYQKVLSCFNFSFEPYGEGTYLHGLNQISEIAVKALSPGINDPGTALIAIDHLSIIFCCLYRQKQPAQPQGFPAIVYEEYSLQQLFVQFIDPICHYGKSDAKVQGKLLDFYDRLLPFVHLPEKEAIHTQLAGQGVSIEKNIESSLQANLLLEKIQKLKTAYYN